MENQVIFLKDVLKQMSIKDRDGKFFPFNISVRTFNKNTKKGGKLKTYSSAKLLPDKNPNSIIVDTVENILLPQKSLKIPNHFENKTRNIETESGEVKKINIDFIIDFNGKKVIY